MYFVTGPDVTEKGRKWKKTQTLLLATSVDRFFLLILVFIASTTDKINCCLYVLVLKEVVLYFCFFLMTYETFTFHSQFLNNLIA